MNDAAAATQGLLAYLAASPSPYHAVDAAELALAGAGFRRLDEAERWTDVTGRAYVVRGGALIAWVADDPEPHRHGIHLVGAHTDSPNLRIKPQADTATAGWRQLAVEVYGGILNNSWLDRDLGVSGRLVLRNGSTTRFLVDRPVARVPQLAVHLDREVNEKGLVLDKQQHLTPVIGLGDLSLDAFRRLAADAAGCDATEIVSWDAMLHDCTPPAVIGIEGELVASARIDNLFSCFTAIEALVAAADAGTTGRIPMVALFDHEEVGSGSTTGAAGPLLEVVIDRVLHALELDRDRRARTMHLSTCVSSDMAHAVHPGYAERHEPGHRPLPNGGPVIKVNANQRYATDAETAARFAETCRRVDVPVQHFVSRNNMPCGSTIGPITATRLGIATVDIGCAMLSMHSARELCGAHDAALMIRALGAHLAGS